MKGKIIKAISGFYYVRSGDDTWVCKARGVFRNIGLHPLPGDNVEFDPVSPETFTGNLTGVQKRNNELIRPAVANIDQSLIVFSVREPDPNLNLLDRYLICMEKQQIPTVIFFNKSDIDRDGEGEAFQEIYRKAGYRVIYGSVNDQKTIGEIRSVLSGKTTALAGPSGVGKSSLTNEISGENGMEVGELSEKIKRGKQTTRHTELIALDPDTFLIDTPGFTSLFVTGIPSGTIREYYPEFTDSARLCRFHECSHIHEPIELCGVKRAVQEGKISRIRYENYCLIFQEIKESERKF